MAVDWEADEAMDLGVGEKVVVLAAVSAADLEEEAMDWEVEVMDLGVEAMGVVLEVVSTADLEEAVKD